MQSDLKWRIYYDDGSTFSWRDGTPFEAPPTGALVVAQESDRTERGFVLYFHKEGWYWKPEFGWWCCDHAGMWDYLMMYRQPKAILFGRNVRDDHFWEVVKKAEKEGIDG